MRTSLNGQSQGMVRPSGCSAFRVRRCNAHTNEVDLSAWDVPTFSAEIDMKGRITQKEIARRLGVSQTLVSRALSGTSAAIRASPGTVERIRREAESMKYRPSVAALTLKGISTRTLGVVVKDFDDPFFGHLMGELHQCAVRENYTLLVTGLNRQGDSSGSLMLLRKYRLDGFILCGSDMKIDDVGPFLEEGRPLVQIGMGDVAKGVQQVGFDEAMGISRLVDYLSRQGHHRIGFVGDGSVSHQRRGAYLRTAVRAVERMECAWFLQASMDDRGIGKIARDMSRGNDGRPGVIVAGDDALANRMLRALYESGIKVPEDVSVAGVDDIPAAALMTPALTTIRQPIKEMVEAAFRLATRGTVPSAQSPVIVDPDLVIRESCAAPRGRISVRGKSAAGATALGV